MPFDEHGNYVRALAAKPKFKRGDYVYLNKNPGIPRSNFWEEFLGHRFVVKEVVPPKFKGGTIFRYYLAPLPGSPAHWDKIAEYSVKDWPDGDYFLGTTCTYVDSLKDAPSYLREMIKINPKNWSGYKCHYLLYKTDSTNKWLSRKTSGKKYRYIYDRIASPSYDMLADPKPEHLIGVRNTNTACWASFSRLMKAVHSHYKVYPDRLFAKILAEDLDYPLKSGKDGKGDYYMGFEDVCKFYKYMKQAKCLPSYFKVPTEKDWNQDLHFEFKLPNLPVNKLFFYLNVLRYPAEKVRLTARVLHLIEKGGLEPLMALIIWHITDPGAGGGHTIMNSMDWGRTTKYYNTWPKLCYPIKTKEVVRYTTKVRKFLTQPVDKPMKVSKQFSFQLSDTLDRQRIRISLPKELPMETAMSFDSATRTFKESE